MLRIRLARRGKKRHPSYRIVVAESTAKRDGRYVEQIGYYNPMVDPIEYKLKEGRALHWLSVGAQPSDAVRRLLDKQGTFGRLERVRAGESIAALAAEFDGVELVEETEEATVVETVVEAVEETVAAAVETVTDAAAAVADKAADVAEAVVDAVTGDDSGAEESADAEAEA